MAVTAQDLLDKVNEGILALVSGRAQKYQVAGRTYEYNDLAELRRLRTALLIEIDQTSSAGATFPIQFA